jgi:hypothetical protein
MSASKASRNRLLTSGIWNFFTPLENSQYATCNICKQKLSYRTTTTNLRRHMMSSHPTVSLNAMAHTTPIATITEVSYKIE